VNFPAAVPSPTGTPLSIAGSNEQVDGVPPPGAAQENCWMIVPAPSLDPSCHVDPDALVTALTTLLGAAYVDSDKQDGSERGRDDWAWHFHRHD
jgi:hypothetical protein